MFALEVEPGLRLELLHHRHVETLLALVDENRQYLRQWLVWVDDTREVVVIERFIESTLRQFADQLGFQAGIFFKHKLVGITGYQPIDPVNGIGEIGYWLSQSHQGQGIMTKCNQAVVRAGFEELGLNKIEIRCATGNLRSRAMAERLGFVEEGVLRQRQWLYDHHVDHVVYSMLKWEFNSR
jgi:ribosomal-protein-serine acetyltransferase